jgi:protein SCO1/2
MGSRGTVRERGAVWARARGLRDAPRGSARGSARGSLCGLLAAALAAALLAGCGSAARHPAAGGATPPRVGAAATTAAELYGLVPEPLPRKPDITLTDTAGRAYNLLSATRGRLTYLYFGYTHCPNACPATMSDIAGALRLVPAAVRRRVAVVFVTVDPRRDTRAVLRSWLDHYGASFVGLRGSAAQIAVAEEATGVPPAPREPQGSGDYSIPHSSILFAYSPDGRSHVIYSQGFGPADLAHDMPLLLRFGG